jgi:UTP:GlnB (protein PII) uridylyltransferase
MNVGWLVTGSIGRLEALKGSDIDLTLIWPKSSVATIGRNVRKTI